MNLICEKCGGQNTLPDGRTSMFCSFCGSSIQQPVEKSSVEENPLKSKPLITEKKVKTWTETVPAYSGRNAVRVSGGYELVNNITDKYGMARTFIRDEVEQYEEVLDEGGELRLSNKGLRSIKNITEWLTDSELESIRILDLSNNYISDLSGIAKMKNVISINLENNKITSFPSAQLPKLQQVNLSNNQITSIQPLFNSSMIDSVNLDNNFITELIVDKRNIQDLKARYLNAKKTENLLPLHISIKGNPIQSFQFFTDLVSIMSNTSLEELSVSSLISDLGSKVRTAKNSSIRDSQLQEAKAFNETLNAIQNQVKVINSIEILIDQDIRKFGFEKRDEKYLYKIPYPDTDVLIKAIVIQAKFGGDLVSFMNQKASLMNSASRRKMMGGIILGIYAIICLSIYSYKVWLFWVQFILIGIVIIILSLKMIFEKEDDF